jgi:hypothetical protein
MPPRPISSSTRYVPICFLVSEDQVRGHAVGRFVEKTLRAFVAGEQRLHFAKEL